MIARKIKLVELALAKETGFIRRQGLLKELWRLQQGQSRSGTPDEGTSKEVPPGQRNGPTVT